MGDTSFEARALASASGLFVVRVATPGERENRGVLELGPGWSVDAVATLACRRLVQRDSFGGERQVAELVESYGFAYVPLPKVALRA